MLPPGRGRYPVLRPAAPPAPRLGHRHPGQTEDLPPSGSWVCLPSYRNGSEVCDDEVFEVPASNPRTALVCVAGEGGIGYVATRTGPGMEDGVSRCQGWEQNGMNAWDHLEYVAQVECDCDGKVVEVDLSPWAGGWLWMGAHDHPNGGGPLTEVCVAIWQQASRSGYAPAVDDDEAIRERYAREGVEGFYRREGASYRNPHEDGVHAILAWAEPRGRVLDLGAGSGEATLWLEARGRVVDACDPWTAEAFRARVGRDCAPWSFVDIVRGCLDDRRWDWIVASFTLHLAPESLLPALGWELARHAPRLLVVTPHKRPALEPRHGWALDTQHLDRVSRVRGRVYRSLAGG